MPRIWLKIAVVTACCALLVSSANALTLEQKIELTKRGHAQGYVPTGYASTAAVGETEPNDDCSAPDAADPFAMEIEAAISPAGDFDYFVFRGDQGDCVTFGTDALNGSATDTQLRIYDTCPLGAAIEFNDDGGPGLFSLISAFELPATGTYYLEVKHFSATGTGEYLLTSSIGICPNPPPNDLCANAERVDCNTVVSGTTLLGENDLDDEPDELCLDFGGSGPDVFYEVCVPIDNQIDVLLTPATSWDPALWLVTDCTDPLSTLGDSGCADAGVLGDAETVSWFNDTGAEACIIIIADSWQPAAFGAFSLEITCDRTVATEAANWGAVKAQFND